LVRRKGSETSDLRPESHINKPNNYPVQVSSHRTNLSIHTVDNIFRDPRVYESEFPGVNKGGYEVGNLIISLVILCLDLSSEIRNSTFALPWSFLQNFTRQKNDLCGQFTSVVRSLFDLTYHSLSRYFSGYFILNSIRYVKPCVVTWAALEIGPCKSVQNSNGEVAIT
jgi:hypothetical protein